MSLAEICENAKMAREYALLGNYDTSLVYYQGVIQQIQKHIQQLKDDAIMKQEWHQVRNNIFDLKHCGIHWVFFSTFLGQHCRISTFLLLNITLHQFFMKLPFIYFLTF